MPNVWRITRRLAFLIANSYKDKEIVL